MYHNDDYAFQLIIPGFERLFTRSILFRPGHIVMIRFNSQVPGNATIPEIRILSSSLVLAMEDDSDPEL